MEGREGTGPGSRGHWRKLPGDREIRVLGEAALPPSLGPDRCLSLNQARMRPGCMSSGASRELETTSVPWLLHERNCRVLESPWAPAAASASSQQPLLGAVGSGLLPAGARAGCYSWLFHMCPSPPPPSRSPASRSPGTLSTPAPNTQPTFVLSLPFCHIAPGARRWVMLQTNLGTKPRPGGRGRLHWAPSLHQASGALPGPSHGPCSHPSFQHQTLCVAHTHRALEGEGQEPEGRAQGWGTSQETAPWDVASVSPSVKGSSTKLGR